MDDERLKRGGSVLSDKYFEEQLQRVREIRLSERKFYQKITDIYATSPSLALWVTNNLAISWKIFHFSKQICKIKDSNRYRRISLPQRHSSGQQQGGSKAKIMRLHSSPGANTVPVTISAADLQTRADTK